MQNTVPPSSVLPLRSSPFLPPLFPSDLAALCVFPPFCNSRRPSVRPGQKTRPRAARCFLKGGRPRPRPISGSNAGGRGISSPGGRSLRRGSGEMRWLSQKLTAKIDRPVDVVAAVLRSPPPSSSSSSAAASEKEQKKALPLLRSLAHSLRSFLRSLAVAAAAAGEDCSCRILLRQRARIVVGALSAQHLASLHFRFAVCT